MEGAVGVVEDGPDVTVSLVLEFVVLVGVGDASGDGHQQHLEADQRVLRKWRTTSNLETMTLPLNMGEL